MLNADIQIDGNGFVGNRDLHSRRAGGKEQCSSQCAKQALDSVLIHNPVVYKVDYLGAEINHA